MTEFRRGEQHGYEFFNTFLQSMARLVKAVYDDKGSEAADEYAAGFLYALEDKMADLEVAVRG